MKILTFHKTTDSDLNPGLQVCYKDTNGAFTMLGEITDILTDKDGIKNYLINTAMGAYMAEELKLIAPLKLNSVKVLFEDSKYNYTTDVSSQTTEITAMQHFVGKCFNMGVFPVENMQQCIGIKFTNNNL
jgi:hypothetical protein